MTGPARPGRRAEWRARENPGADEDQEGEQDAGHREPCDPCLAAPPPGVVDEDRPVLLLHAEIMADTRAGVQRYGGGVRLLTPPAVRFAVLVAVLAGVALLLGLHGLPDRSTLSAAVARTGPAAPVVGVLGGAVLVAAMVPRTLLAFVGGLLFGVVGGGAYALAGALLGASLAYAVGRLLGRDFVAARLGVAGSGRAAGVRGRLERMDGWLGRRGLFGVWLVRMFPLAPFGVMSYLLGTTSARYRHFVGGSALAAAPSSFGYAAAGAAVLTADPVVIGLALAGLGLLGALGLAGAMLARNRLARAGAAGPVDEPG